MADELVIFVVRDNAGNARDLGELVDAAANEWALRSHDPKVFFELQAIKGNTDQLEGFVDGVEGLLAAIRDNVDQLEGYSDGIETLLTTIRDNADTVEALLGSLVTQTDQVESKLDALAARIPEPTLTSRMRIGQPAPGYQLWMDLADAAHWYLLEAPLAATAGIIGFRGIRVKLVSGNPVGKVETNEGATLTFNNRKTNGSWA